MWFSNSISTSMRFYYDTKQSGRWSHPESFGKESSITIDILIVSVPVGHSCFPKEGFFSILIDLNQY
jgi:hypothetical protein